MAQVWRQTKNDDKPVSNHCMATIINDNWLLAAASCLPLDYRNYRITLPNYYTATEYKVEEYLKIKRILKAKEYNPTRGAGYDLALIHLKVGLQLHTVRKNARAVCMPLPYETPQKQGDTVKPSSECYFDSCLTTGVDPKPIIQAPIKVKVNTNCPGTMFKKDFMLCANVGVYEKNNGAPIVCKSNTNKYFLAAMASWGHLKQKVDNPKSPIKNDFFTNILRPEYITWINETVNQPLDYFE